MSFFSKIKHGLGMGTISFELVVPDSIAGSSGQFQGDIVITAKSPQKVKDVEAKFERVLEWEEMQMTYNSTSKQNERTWVGRSETVQLGAFVDKSGFSLAQDERKTIHFTISFAPFSDEGGQGHDSASAWGLLDAAVDVALSIDTSGNFGPSTRNQSVHYRVSGDADLEDVAFDKGDSRRIAVV